MLLQAITARGFSHCQSDRSGMDCAFPRGSWHKVKPRSVHSSPSAASWSFPIMPRHSSPRLHPPHCPQGPYLPNQLNQKFMGLAISAANQKDGQGAISVPNDFIEKKERVRTSPRREPIAHWTKSSSRHCLTVHSYPQKFRDSRIRKQEDLLSNEQVRS